MGHDVGTRGRAACSHVAQGPQQHQAAAAGAEPTYRFRCDPQASLARLSQVVAASSTPQELVTCSWGNLHHVVQLVHRRPRRRPAVEQSKALRLPVLIVHLRRLAGRRAHGSAHKFGRASPCALPCRRLALAAGADRGAAKTLSAIRSPPSCHRHALWMVRQGSKVICRRSLDCTCSLPMKCS